MKILNLYAGLGGNRKLWTGHQVTAVEIRRDIAEYYMHRFPDDVVVIGDAHQYLLDHYSEFDFIWSSPPCPSHSRARYFAYRDDFTVPRMYPDMSLYQEIILLQYYFKGLFTVENVNPFYDSLIRPTVTLGRHYFWANFGITRVDVQDADINQFGVRQLQKFHGFNLKGFSFDTRKDDMLRNCVAAETGLHILECAMGSARSRSNQLAIF